MNYEVGPKILDSNSSEADFEKTIAFLIHKKMTFQSLLSAKLLIFSFPINKHCHGRLPASAASLKTVKD